MFPVPDVVQEQKHVPATLAAGACGAGAKVQVYGVPQEVLQEVHPVQPQEVTRSSGPVSLQNVQQAVHLPHQSQEARQVLA